MPLRQGENFIPKVTFIPLKSPFIPSLWSTFSHPIPFSNTTTVPAHITAQGETRTEYSAYISPTQKGTGRNSGHTHTHTQMTVLISMSRSERSHLLHRARSSDSIVTPRPRWCVLKNNQIHPKNPNLPPDQLRFSSPVNADADFLLLTDLFSLHLAGCAPVIESSELFSSSFCHPDAMDHRIPMAEPPPGRPYGNHPPPRNHTCVSFR